jgi:iron complex outermembrane recepter protein
MDSGWEKDEFTVHLSVSEADNVLGATGPTPVEDLLLFTGDVYYRHFNQHLIDGNLTDVMTCVNNSNFFCLEGNNLIPADVLYDSNGNQVPTSVLPPGATPGEIDLTATSAPPFSRI